MDLNRDLLDLYRHFRQLDKAIRRACQDMYLEDGISPALSAGLSQIQGWLKPFSPSWRFW
jgi:hypothetical protein